MLNVEPLKQKFLPESFVIGTWEDIEPYIDDLLGRPITTMAEYQRFLEDESELSAVISEDSSMRYVRMTCRTDNEELEEHYTYFVQHIGPKLSEASDKLNRKIASSAFAQEVPESGFALALKGIQTDINLFRVENIPLGVKEDELVTEVGKIKGAMTVTLDGEEMPLPKAADRLFWLDRGKREEAWVAMRVRHYQDKDALDGLFAQLTVLRDQKADNAGFDNYRDYMFAALKRYDYLPESCYLYHEAAEKTVVPVQRAIYEHQARELGLEKLRPWDTEVDALGRPPLKAFTSADDLVAKSLQALGNIDPLFHDTLLLMQQQGKLDLAARAHKRPGAYMMPLLRTKLPFIFGNATEQVNDMVTLMHEVGHAVHDVQMRDLRLVAYTRYPSEVAELASMTMELITHDQWHVFFPNEEDLKRAKRDHLERIIFYFLWIPQIDAFQHEIYLKPAASVEERHDIWKKISDRFSTGMIDWSGFEQHYRTLWHKQGHVFELPFYYIEYAIAQLGALQIWRNYKQDKKQALDQYKNALALGYTKSIPEMYEKAGVKFDFSVNMLQDLMAFVQKEYEALL